MPGEHLQVVAEAFEAWNEGDYAAAVEHFCEDGEWYPYLGVLDAPVYRGRDQLEALFRDLSEHLQVRMQLVSIEEVGEGALCCVRAEGAGVGSGASAGAEWFQVYSFDGGLIQQVRAFEQREAAIQAAKAGG